MMRLPIALLCLALLAGCAHKPGTGSIADAATTYAALADGGSELNPLIGWSGDPVVTVLTALAVKQGAKYGLEGLGYSHCRADRLVEIAGWFGAGWNVPMLIAKAASATVAWPVTLATGGASAFAYYRYTAITQKCPSNRTYQ